LTELFFFLLRCVGGFFPASGGIASCYSVLVGEGKSSFSRPQASLNGFCLAIFFNWDFFRPNGILKPILTSPPRRFCLFACVFLVYSSGPTPPGWFFLRDQSSLTQAVRTLSWASFFSVMSCGPRPSPFRRSIHSVLCFPHLLPLHPHSHPLPAPIIGALVRGLTPPSPHVASGPPQLLWSFLFAFLKLCVTNPIGILPLSPFS